MELIRAIYEYEIAVEKLPKTINNSAYKNEFLIEKLDMINVSFYKKLRNKRFSTNMRKAYSEYYSLMIIKSTNSGNL